MASTGTLSISTRITSPRTDHAATAQYQQCVPRAAVLAPDPDSSSSRPGPTRTGRTRIDCRACRSVGARRALTELQAFKARQMHDETDGHGKCRYTVAQIAETFSVSRKTIYRHLDRPAPSPN